MDKKQFIILVVLLYVIVFFIPMCTPLFKHNYKIELKDNCDINKCVDLANNHLCRSLVFNNSYDINYTKKCLCNIEWCFK